MTNAAIISGSLVDVRNVGTHKSVKLTVHVPEEYAMKVVEAFGWPTGVNPIPVAIARLDPKKTKEPREKKSWHDMPPAQQAGLLSNETAFLKFMSEQKGYTHNDGALMIRQECGISSRKDILPGTPAGDKWTVLVSEYRAWMREPEIVG